MAARKVRPAPPKKLRRKPKLDPREKALVEWYFRKGPGARIMSEPTMRDMTQAAAFISEHCKPAFSPVEATHALSWLIAKLRDDEREACAKTAEYVPVADRNPALVRNEIADKIRARMSPTSSDNHSKG